MSATFTRGIALGALVGFAAAELDPVLGPVVALAAAVVLMLATEER